MFLQSQTCAYGVKLSNIFLHLTGEKCVRQEENYEH
jgi:hypothetical protein